MGAIIGIAVGCGVVGLGLLGCLVWCILKRCFHWGSKRDLYAQENAKTITPMAANPFWMRGKNANGTGVRSCSCSAGPRLGAACWLEDLCRCKQLPKPSVQQYCIFDGHQSWRKP